MAQAVVVLPVPAPAALLLREMRRPLERRGDGRLGDPLPLRRPVHASQHGGLCRRDRRRGPVTPDLLLRTEPSEAAVLLQALEFAIDRRDTDPLQARIDERLAEQVLATNNALVPKQRRGRDRQRRGARNVGSLEVGTLLLEWLIPRDPLIAIRERATHRLP